MPKNREYIAKTTKKENWKIKLKKTIYKMKKVSYNI